MPDKIKMNTLKRPTSTHQKCHHSGNLFGICLLICSSALLTESEAHVLVYQLDTSEDTILSFHNKLIEEYNDMPALFGKPIPSNGLRVYPIVAKPDGGCTNLTAPPTHNYPPDAQFVALIKRGLNCSFADKVRNAQAARFDAAIVYNIGSDDLEQMSAKNANGIHISAVFVGETSGLSLKTYCTGDYVLLINDELPFNINTQLILPFSILMALCFLSMIFYMIYKCIRERRRIRRHRLPKSMLKKLVILKFTKNCNLGYDSCVICLEEFAEGDKLRVLPCRHPYHSHCIDQWLTEIRRVCPVCKRKVFKKVETRSLRNRQTSLDNITDTDDDTTPLLQQPRAQSTRGGNRGADSSSRVPATTQGQSERRASATAAGSSGVGRSSQHHGTFRRSSSRTSDVERPAASNSGSISDDENLLADADPPTSVVVNTNGTRVNPFDRSPILPPGDQEERSMGDALRSMFRSPLNWFRRPERNVSVVSPPYLEEGVIQRSEPPAVIHSIGVPGSIAVGPQPVHSSNNIMNPNLGGSFKNANSNGSDDGDSYESTSIYEHDPRSVVAIQAPRIDPSGVTDTNDLVFIQTPTQGGIGVVALPNDNNPAAATIDMCSNVVDPNRRNYLV